MATVMIPPSLRKITGGKSKIQQKASDLENLIESLDDSFPGLRSAVLTETRQLRRFVSVFIDNEDARYLDGLKSKLSDSSKVVILTAVAGG